MPSLLRICRLCLATSWRSTKPRTLRPKTCGTCPMRDNFVLPSYHDISTMRSTMVAIGRMTGTRGSQLMQSLVKCIDFCSRELWSHSRPPPATSLSPLRLLCVCLTTSSQDEVCSGPAMARHRHGRHCESQASWAIGLRCSSRRRPPAPASSPSTFTIAAFSAGTWSCTRSRPPCCGIQEAARAHSGEEVCFSIRQNHKLTHIDISCLASGQHSRH